MGEPEPLTYFSAGLGVELTVMPPPEEDQSLLPLSPYAEGALRALLARRRALPPADCADARAGSVEHPAPSDDGMP